MELKGVEKHCLNFGMQTLWKKKKELNGSEKMNFKQSVEGNGDDDDDSVGSQYLLISICCVLGTVLNPVHKLFNPHNTLPVGTIITPTFQIKKKIKPKVQRGEVCQEIEEVKTEPWHLNLRKGLNSLCKW